MRHALQSARGLASAELPRSGNRTDASNQIVGSRHSVSGTAASADCVAADGARSCPTDEWGSLVLSPAISMVPIGPPSDHNYPARDPGALASVRLSPVLALEIR